MDNVAAHSMTGKQIHLRALEPSDIDVLYQWENDPSVWRMSNTSAPFSRFALEQYVLGQSNDIFASRQLRLMIVLKEEPSTPIGAIDLFDFEPLHGRVGMGILITEAFRGKGYASEAIQLLLNYCFDTLNLHQVYCNISEDNEASIKIFTAAGFLKNGVKKEWNRHGGLRRDEYFFQYIRK